MRSLWSELDGLKKSNPLKLKSIIDSISAISESELYERYDGFLDDIYGQIDVCGFKYCASRALKEIDIVVYDCGFNDWLDSERDIIIEWNGDYFEHDEIAEQLDCEN